MYVCVCKAVTDSDLARAIACGADTVEAVARCTGAGRGCGGCRGDVEAALEMAGRPSKRFLMLLPALAAIAS